MAKHDAGNDNRREQRRHAECRATAKVSVSVQIIDASTNGLRARMSLTLPVGTMMKIALPGGTERHVRIAWTAGEEIGCEFMAPLKPEELERLLAATAIARPSAAG